MFNASTICVYPPCFKTLSWFLVNSLSSYTISHISMVSHTWFWLFKAAFDWYHIPDYGNTSEHVWWLLECHTSFYSHYTNSFFSPTGQIMNHNYFNLLAFTPTTHPAPKAGLGPYHSAMPSYWFPGKPNYYFRVPNNGALNYKSVTIFAFLKQPKFALGPIVEWEGYQGQPFGTHFWIWANCLFTNLKHNHGQDLSVVSHLSVPAGRWNFVGMSYNHETGMVVMWVNGEIFLGFQFREKTLN